MRTLPLATIALAVAGCEPRATRLAAPPTPEAVAFVAESDVRRVAVGWNDICLVMSDGTARCKQDWRPAGARRLGSFVTVTGAEHVDEIAAGHHHACARTDAGSVLCWGRNDSGEVSGNDQVVRSARVVPLPAPAAEVRVGDTQSCARLTSNAVYCWGAVAGTEHAPPTPLQWFANSVGLGVSFDALCAFDGSGLLRCSFGGGKPLEPVADDVKVSAVALARFRGCALMADRTVRCFPLKQPVNAPVTGKVPPWAEQVVGLEDVVQLVAGTAHFCALRGNGTVACWGRNEYGQLGDGSRTDAPLPVAVSKLADARELGAGGDRTCASRAKGVVCWGADLLADAMFRALTGLAVDPGPPGPNDSLVPEVLRVPAHTAQSNGAAP